ncbi:Uncharacterized protein TCM_034005 [Theobroma cacao]|uniref:Uncharacterized protein n=1 Tax=Theobroma cacao TaxID=3641 RepID=A0A061FCV9_THECC|nr:Uncharacterized protein TCM_034005 [Theobroma cacao]
MRVHSDEVLVFYGSVLSLLDVVLVWIFSLREYLANVWLVRGENREREREKEVQEFGFGFTSEMVTVSISKLNDRRSKSEKGELRERKAAIIIAFAFTSEAFKL